MFYHTYTPTPHGPAQQLVWGHELRWAHPLGRRRLQRDTLETQQATPILRDLALDLAPKARFGHTLH